MTVLLELSKRRGLLRPITRAARVLVGTAYQLAGLCTRHMLLTRIKCVITLPHITCMQGSWGEQAQEMECCASGLHRVVSTLLKDVCAS